MTRIESEVGPTVGQVQTDTFCEGCGYNLLTQAVMRDERLGILVCRCPECGRYSAAGRTTSADRVWLNRLGTVTLVGWVFFVLGLFSLCAMFFGMLAYGQTEEMTEMQTTGGSGVTYSYHYVVRDTSAMNEEQSQRYRMSQTLFFLTGGLLGLIAGGLFSTFFWHVRGWRRGLAALPALVGVGFAIFSWINDPTARWLRGWGAARMSVYLVYIVICIAVGVVIGRAVARGMLGVLVPPRARQHLAFLWITDGKVLKS